MKLCIAGVGAIGGFIGTRLALAGEAQVSALARGATLAALQQHGLRLRQGGQLHSAPVQASSDPATLGVQDVVVITVQGIVLVGAAFLLGLRVPAAALLIALVLVALRRSLSGWYGWAMRRWPASTPVAALPRRCRWRR